MRRLLVVSLLASALVVVAQPAAWACECVPGGFADRAETAEAVFTGVVRDFHEEQVLSTVDFAVERVYLGEVGDTLDLATPGDGSSCAVRWEEGTRYTVAAYHNPDGALEANLCSGILRGAIDPAEYGLPPGESRDPPPPGYSWWVYPAGILLGVAGSWLIIRRLQRRRG